MKAAKKFFLLLFIIVALLAIAFAALVIHAVMQDSGPPADLQVFSEDSLERSIDEAWRNGEAELTLRYEAEGLDLPELERSVEAYLARLGEQNPRYWYTVKNADYTLSDFEDYLEADLVFTYQEQPCPYDDLPRAATPQEALTMLAPALRSGETAFTFLAANGWTTDDLNTLASELATNSVELAAETNLYHYSFVQGDMDPCDYVSIELEYRMDQELLLGCSLEMRETLDEIAAEIAAAGGDTRDRYLAAARAVMDRTEYDDDVRIASYTDSLTDEQKITRSAYGAVVAGHTVCTGYAMAYKAICDRLELPCWIISGYKGDGSHVWNRIVLDGQILYMDCTFADGMHSEAYLFMGEQTLADEDYYYPAGQLCPWGA